MAKEHALPAFCSQYVTARARRTHLQPGKDMQDMPHAHDRNWSDCSAMLAGGVGIAVAQTSTTTTSPSAASPGSVKCWDSATKQVRNQTPSTSTGSSTSSIAGPAPAQRELLRPLALPGRRKPPACRIAAANSKRPSLIESPAGDGGALFALNPEFERFSAPFQIDRPRSG